MGMDQYLLIPFLGEWTSIYQLFWCSPGVQGFDTLPYHKIAIQSTWNHPSNANKFTNRRWFCRVKSCVAKKSCHYISSPFWPHVQLCEGKLHETCVSSLTSNLEGKEQSKLLLFPRIEVTCCRKIPLSVAETGWYMLIFPFQRLFLSPLKTQELGPWGFPGSWVACSWKILAETEQGVFVDPELRWSENIYEYLWISNIFGLTWNPRIWIGVEAMDFSEFLCGWRSVTDDQGLAQRWNHESFDARSSSIVSTKKTLQRGKMWQVLCVHTMVSSASE